MKSQYAFVPHYSSVELFQFKEKEEISRTPEMFLKYLSHSMSVVAVAWECTAPDQSYSPTMLLADAEYFSTDPIIAVPERLTSGFQLNSKWESQLL